MYVMEDDKMSDDIVCGNENVALVEQRYELPQPEDLNGKYRYVLNDEIDKSFFWQDDEEEPSGVVDFQAGMLVWVLKSKGKRSRVKKTAMSDASRQPDESGEKKELFLRARVVSTESEDEEGSSYNSCCDDSGKKKERRILIRYPKGSTYHVRESFLIPVLENNNGRFQEPIVIVASETPEYRRSSAVHTCVGESFLEIGCDFGICVDKVRKFLTDIQHVPIENTTSTTTTTTNTDQTTQIVSHNNTDNVVNDNNNNETNDDGKRVFCLGIDKSQTSLDIAEERYPDTTFSLEDALTEDGTAKLRTLCKEHMIGNYPSVVAIDINGNREVAGVLHCLRNVMKPGPDVVVGKDW
eukprot:CAMPEP_0197828336 /NCGR_PEP_ID=MMETSP1437-20131217/4919_1 /TAXON_ID=49252 ORGANISM="Eucampia antarctica, Strain CCMP1452" /NCGR_SAMPLE_ID=MMETSP1437 /ASSEMBLY_ACC=CAM_ASM_001096 /LENGTH=352 /DNA_ID=CAMNT_0043429509 /DNA_START=105 /DNA_END=1160 /DNA_ORIENTATION=+